MISKLVNRELKSVTAAAVIISISALASKLVGLFRDRLFAHYFGAGTIMDSYYAAFKIPDLVYNLLIAGALTAGFIPTFSKLFFTSDDKKPAWRLANNILSIVGVTLIVVALLGILFTNNLTAIIAPGFAGETKTLAISFTRIMFLSPFFLGLSMVLGGILQSLKQFVIYSLAPIAYNIGIILGTVLLTKTSLGIFGLAWGVVLGSALHAAVQLYGALHTGWRWCPVFDLKNLETRLIGKLMIPRTIGLAISQFNAVIITILASYLVAGSITIYNLANNLYAVPISLIGIPFAIAVFPVLSELAAKKERIGFAEHLSSTLRTVIFLILPLSVIMLVLRAQIIRVVFGTGQFDWMATITTARTLAFFALGLLGASLLPTLARAFYALSDTVTPFIIGIFSEIVTIISALILMKPFDFLGWYFNLGVSGLALATSIGISINALLLVVALAKKTKNIEAKNLFLTLIKTVVASILMAATMQYLKTPLVHYFDLNYFWGIFGQGMIAGSTGLIVYCLVSYVLKVPEMTLMLGTLEKRWLRLKNVPAGIDEAEKM